jgi:iron complex outermembrane receptor protein
MRKLLVASLLASTFAVSAPVLAQEAGEAAAAGGDEIIVTARRVEENLSTVPAAITAFSAKDLIDRQIKTDSDLQLATPGLTIRQTQGNNSLTYSIRGQTADTFSGTPSAVIAYFNEVPLTTSSASSFYDLANVQVLKGPQGTLFGRNATGGAVLYNSAKPTNELAGSLRGRIGNLGQREVEGMINVPLVDDTVLLRGAFSVVRRDGYIHNLFNGQDLGRIERNSGRVSLTLKPTENFTNLTTFQYTDVDGTNTGASYVWSVYQCGQTNNGFALNCAAAAVYPGLANYPALQRQLGLYTTNHPGGARHHGYDWIVTNTTSLELSDDLTIKNIFGASRSKVNSVQPQLGAPFVTIATYNAATGQVGNNLDIETYSDELQLQGTALDGRLSYIVGAYFQWQTVDTIWPQSYFLATPFPPLQPACGSCVTNAFRSRNTSKAIFTQGSYEVADGLKLTAGVRYTWENIRFSQINVPGNFFATAPEQRVGFSDPSWEFGLEYKASSDLFVYAKTRGSFRSGGFSGAATPPIFSGVPNNNRFNPEHTQDIEVGLKYHGHAFGRPATFNIDAFNQWVQDVQRVEFPVGGAVTVNVPSQIVQGVEAEFMVRPADWLEIGGQAAYVNARYTNGRVLLLGTTYLYGPVADTPEFSGSAYVQVSLPVPEDTGRVTFRTDVYGQTSQYFSNASASYTPDVKLPGYFLVHARLAWENIMKSGFSLAAYGKNLGNRGYFVGGMPLGNALGHNAAAVGEPRTYGIEASVKF